MMAMRCSLRATAKRSSTYAMKKPNGDGASSICCFFTIFQTHGAASCKQYSVLSTFHSNVAIVLSRSLSHANGDVLN
eukprot:5625095-Amphidinium_carterae.1